MIEAFGDTLADREYYAPAATVADPGPRFAPTRVPAGRSGVAEGIWTVWGGQGPRADQGWKIHVSARLERAQHVLDEVAAICFAEGVPFKHLSARLFFLLLHHKHAGRAQSGKFCAVYPPDTASARRLLERLAEALDGEEGPYVLSDRRFGDSRTVHYRYGSFGGGSRLRPDGSREALVRDGSGREVPDLRHPAFLLPEGVTDPFVPAEEPTHSGPILIGGYQVTRAVRLSNAGGTYRARDTRSGRTVFIKEARAHTGLGWDGSTAKQRLRHEHRVLSLVHAAAPGVCPEPLDYVTEWEHEFLVTEYVDGQSLVGWLSRNSPLGHADRTPESVTAYYDAGRRILGDVDAALDRLHALGYRFGDVSPGNVIVTPSGEARLVDFEAATELSADPSPIGTQGFAPPAALARGSSDPLLTDRYGSAALALALLAPFQDLAGRAPGNLALLHRDLADVAPPKDLWARATTFHRPDGTAPVATPAEVDADPLGCLARLADGLAAGLLAMADTGRTDRALPLPPAAFRTNGLCLAHGSAGVVHALHLAGVEIPAEIGARLRRDVLTHRDTLPPGVNAGSAGIARVLAGLGHLEEALDLLRRADGHPLTDACGTLADGRAGVGLTWLALHRRTGDDRHLEYAAAAGDLLLRTAEPPTLGAYDARGLHHGRSGLALFLHRLAGATGEPRYLDAGRRLLHEELDRALPMPDGSLSFSDHARTGRAMPYLAVGAAGVGTVLARYAAAVPDQRFAEALPRVLAGTRTSASPKEAGLHQGLAGLVWFLADHAELTGSASDRESAVRLATGLLKYAVPAPRGVRFLGAGGRRFSADLGSGGAGVLVALHRLLNATHDPVAGSTPGAAIPNP